MSFINSSLGHKNIAFLGGEGQIDVRMQRISGYAGAMAARSLEPTIVWPCRETKEAAAEALPQLLQQHPETTAIVCSGDMVAMGATLGLGQLGKTVGKDISIIGFDGAEEAALWTPPLTTMTVNAFALGEQLAQVLLDRIANPKSATRSINLSAHLDIRQTTGPLV